MERQLPSTQDYIPPAGQATSPGAEAVTVASAAGTSSGAGAPPVAIPGYRLGTELGRGGMGVVYTAVQLGLNRPVALKMLLSGAWASPGEVERFRLEAEAVAQLDHANIIPVYEVGVQDGLHYFSMKLVEGSCSLAQQMARLAADLRAAVRLLATVAGAVHYAHQRGIMHRDLKPANILIGPDQHPYVTDFGLAKRTAGGNDLTQPGAVVGTPSYMAPEQARGQKTLTTAVDVYALGAILYEVLTGRPPFRAETPLDTLLQVLELDPERPRAVNPAADPDLEAVCLKCLARNPQERYASAADLAADLERWLQGEPLSVRPLRLASLLRLWVRHNFGAGTWVVGLGLAWGLLNGVFGWLVAINPLGLSDGLRVAVYFLGIAISSSAGLLTAALVRPRDAAADLVAGLGAGLLAAVTAYTISWGWVAVVIAEQMAGPAGIPYGIWGGMVGVVGIMGSIFVVETLAAGSLLRRHVRVRLIIGPYFELVIPAMLLVLLGGAIASRWVYDGLSRHAWLVPALFLLALALAGVHRKWHWALRAFLHAAWLIALGAGVAMRIR
jgi:hypothetical protein